MAGGSIVFKRNKLKLHDKKNYTYAYVLIITVLTGCRKDGSNIDIKQYDTDQIQAYIRKMA